MHQGPKGQVHRSGGSVGLEHRKINGIEKPSIDGARWLSKSDCHPERSEGSLPGHVNSDRYTGKSEEEMT